MSKIAVLAHLHNPIVEPYAGGLEMHTHLLVKTLGELGHEVTLFAKGGSDVGDYKLAELVPLSFHFEPLPHYSPAWIKQEAKVRKAYVSALNDIDGDFDFVINNSLNPAPWDVPSVVPTLTILHTPVLPLLEVAAPHGNNDPAKLFASVSTENAALWTHLLSDINVVSNGIDVERWRSSEQRSDELRWSGRIAPEKGLADAIKAAKLSGRKILIAGPVSDQAYFQHEVRPLLGDAAEYVGHLGHNELREFYATGAVTVVTPKWEEPFGLVIAESLATGTPVAAYDRGAMRSMINNSTGSLALDNTPNGLALAIEAAVRCNAESCRQFANHNFSAARMVRAYLELLNGARIESTMDEACVG